MQHTCNGFEAYFWNYRYFRISILTVDWCHRYIGEEAPTLRLEDLNQHPSVSLWVRNLWFGRPLRRASASRAAVIYFSELQTAYRDIFSTAKPRVLTSFIHYSTRDFSRLQVSRFSFLSLYSDLIFGIVPQSCRHVVPVGPGVQPNGVPHTRVSVFCCYAHLRNATNIFVCCYFLQVVAPQPSLST